MGSEDIRVVKANKASISLTVGDIITNQVDEAVVVYIDYCNELVVIGKNAIVGNLTFDEIIAGNFNKVVR